MLRIIRYYTMDNPLHQFKQGKRSKQAYQTA